MKKLTIEKTLDVCYNLDYLIIVPLKDEKLFEDINYTFGNTLLFKNSIEDTEFLINFLKKNTIGQLIFVDYYIEYDEIISTLVDEHSIKFVFTKSLGELSDEYILDDFTKICEKYERGEIETIGFLDPYLFEVMHPKYRKTNLIQLDTIPIIESEHKKSDTIGLLGVGNSNYCSFYNEMSALSFLDQYKAKLYCPVEEATKFAIRYGIKYEVAKKTTDVLNNNVCNLDINFTGTLPTNFIKSMDRGIPCVIGNNAFLPDEYSKIKRYLVVESDDDVDEIALKVEEAIKNKSEILKEYKRFRSKYSENVKELAKKFINFEIETLEEKEYEKILTVVVPVYNTEKYIKKCLESVIMAAIPEMEILIVDDGSTDKSGKIAKQYANERPDLIRYIKQENRGLGNVRNVGLEQAKGKYLASVDSDDTIESEFFKNALPYMKKDTDVIICDWMSINEKESFETTALDQVFDKRKEMEGLLYTTIMPSTCNKIMKKSLFTNNKIKYLEQKYEDLSANPIALLKAKTIKYFHKPYYNYYLSENSLMRSKINPKHMVDAILFLDDRISTKNELIKMDEFKYYTYSWRIEEYIINPLYEIKGRELDSCINYIYKNLYKIIVGIFDNSYYKEMLDGLNDKELTEYIKERNAAFRGKKLTDFIIKSKEIKKLNAGIIYYGD